MSANPKFLSAQHNTSARCLVVGLLDRQIEIIRREFPALRIDHVPGGPEVNGRTNDIAALGAKADRVFLLAKFVGHNKSIGIPRDKLAHCTGLDSLRQALARYAANVVFSGGDTKVVPLIGTNAEGQLVDMGAPILDWSALRKADAGQVVSFTRPDGMAAHLFTQHLNTAREHYRRHYGIETVCEMHGARADVTVAKCNTPDFSEPGPAVAIRPPTLLERAQDFWRDVYKESFRRMPYAVPEVHAATANAAVEGWLTICGHKGQ